MEDKKTRQLAAVMFTDIVGYTAIMQQDESRALRVRKKHRSVFQKQHELHHGKIIQYYGDGTLSVFKSAIEATNCAIAIQQLLQADDINGIPLRIGLHLGDIIYSETEVYGDGVNVASRIESMGISGSILISGKVNEELKNQPSITTIALGNFEFKNVSAPIEVFAISNDGIKIPKNSQLKGKQQQSGKTIAVLPFANMSASQENEFFCDGITEEIINALAKIKQLKVTSRTSSFFFKNKNFPITQIGKELNVSTILEGSVRIAGKMIRITAQLIQAEDDFHFWSETWDRKLENIFEIQDEISLAIADKLREQFGHFEIQNHLVEKQTENFDAYELSLKAKFHFNKWNAEDVQIAIPLYEKALELDPNHTASLVGAADCYSFMATTGFLPLEEAWSKSYDLTNRALNINPELPGGLYQLANYSFFILCDYAAALKLTLQVLELKSNYVDARQFLSFLYIIAGKKDAAEKQLEIALGIDPLSPETLFFNAYFHYMTEDYEKSLELLDKCLAQNEKNIPAHSIKCYCLLKLGQYDEALHYYEKVPEEIVVQGDKLGITALAYAFKKDAANTKKYLEILLQKAAKPEGFREQSFLFLMYGITSNFDKAFEWIKEALENKASFLLFHFADPMVDPIKNDPRYQHFQGLIFGENFPREKKGTKKPLLDKRTTHEYSERLISHIKEHEPYLDPNLSLRSLARQINLHPNQLSWLLNESLGKNFSEFINYYRVEKFKALSQDPEKNHITLIGLAYESGFNSKTVFNTYFKKETGLTPKQYLKLQEKK
ncbi:tetratricopeptide repeat protein [Flexithrix dorotheae]|uniref:tetratricopeptide repeat protein n=1 Tax=Flexithrix dorotheae TaxID=70993 RepID=UPI00036BA3B9|nr:tetratricopeptide repeat protein [Flexithrix dorotheae]